MTPYDWQKTIARFLYALGDPLPFDYSVVNDGTTPIHKNVAPVENKIWIVTGLTSYHNDAAARQIVTRRLRGGSDSQLHSMSVAAGVYTQILAVIGVPFFICTPQSYIVMDAYAVANAKTWWVQGEYYELSNISELLV